MGVKVGLMLEREVLLKFVGMDSKVFNLAVFIPCSPWEITDICREVCCNVVYNHGIPVIKSGGQART